MFWRVKFWFRYTVPRWWREFWGWVGRGFKPVPPLVFNNIQEFCEHLESWPDEGDAVNLKQIEKRTSTRVYKYTSCGAWLCFVYTPDPKKESQEIPAHGVFGVWVGSIVEGVDACAEGDKLYFPFTEPEYDAEVADVEAEVDRIWNDTHGCSHCWTEGPCNPDHPEDACNVAQQLNDGSIDPNCKACGGDGVII